MHSNIITVFHKKYRWSILCFALIGLCFSQNQTTYSVACLVTAWLVIVEGFDQRHNMSLKFLHVN